MFDGELSSRIVPGDPCPPSICDLSSHSGDFKQCREVSTRISSPQTHRIGQDLALTVEFSDPPAETISDSRSDRGAYPSPSGAPKFLAYPPLGMTSSRILLELVCRFYASPARIAALLCSPQGLKDTGLQSMCNPYLPAICCAQESVCGTHTTMIGWPRVSESLRPVDDPPIHQVKIDGEIPMLWLLPCMESMP